MKHDPTTACIALGRWNLPWSGSHRETQKKCYFLRPQLPDDSGTEASEHIPPAWSSTRPGGSWITPPTAKGFGDALQALDYGIAGAGENRMPLKLGLAKPQRVRSSALDRRKHETKRTRADESGFAMTLLRAYASTDASS